VSKFPTHITAVIAVLSLLFFIDYSVYSDSEAKNVKAQNFHQKCRISEKVQNVFFQNSALLKAQNNSPAIK
jgi:hypothetical protein